MRSLRNVWLLFAVAAVTGGSTAVENYPTIDRRGSFLKIDWLSDTDGTWEVADNAGNVCAAGRVERGQNTVTLPKISAPTELKLTLRATDSDGGSTVVRIPAVKRLSTLDKPAEASIVYQVPVRTYFAKGTGADNAGRLRELTTERLQEIKSLGVDYLWLTGVLEHAERTHTDPDVVKGDAGSYYAIYDSWDVSAQIGILAEFEGMIDRAHAVGLRVLVDFVPNHTARMHRTDVACKQHLDPGVSDQTDTLFRPSNNYYYITGRTFTPPAQSGGDGADGVFDTAPHVPGVQMENPARVTGNDIISATPLIYDWFETVKLNYGWDLVDKRAFYNPRPKTWDLMVDVAKYWVEKGVDGFRVDFAHAVPVEFWRFFASELKKVQPQVYLLAEAYESDHRMMIPGFSYQAMLEAGFDSVYDSEMYWAMHNQVQRVDMRAAVPSRSPGMVPGVVNQGFMFTRYLENHDEVRVASRHFAPWIGDRAERARLGLAYTAWLGLMPGNLMLHGGQELQEDASIYGRYAGDNGRTSIFDFIYQSQTRTWWYSTRPAWMAEFRDRYKSLLTLKRQAPFNLRHQTSEPSLVDLDGVNSYKDQSKWIGAYIRFGGGSAWLVVTNADPFVGHEATIHFTGRDGMDTLGALRAMGVANSDRRWIFREDFSRPGWIPVDPAVSGEGVPGSALWRSGNIPSGLFLGVVPPATTYAFRIEAR